MRHGAGLFVLLCLLSPLGAEERTIQLPEVSVRAGPGIYFDPTDVLHHGDKVEVKHVLHGFAAIVPPRGAFSLIPQSALIQTSTISATVKQPYVQTLVGSNLTFVANRPGIQLQRGQKVNILENVFLVQSGRPEPYFKIVPPPGELRYLPVQAFQPLPAAPPPEEQKDSADNQTAYYPPDPQTTLLLREADEAYQRGFKTNNWEEARRKYTQLAESPNHYARMTALNRLEFIRRAMANPPRQNMGQGPTQPAVGPAAGSQVQNPDWRQATGKPAVPAVPATPTGNERIPPTDTPPANPFPQPGQPGATGSPPPIERQRPTTPVITNQRPTTTVSGQRPITPIQGQGKGIENHFPTPVAPGAQPQVGTLQQAFQSDVMGRPLYYLTSSNGLLVCFLSPMHGIDLQPFVGRPVEVRGTPLTPRPDLRGNQHMVVHQIRALSSLTQQ